MHDLSVAQFLVYIIKKKVVAIQDVDWENAEEDFPGQTRTSMTIFLASEEHRSVVEKTAPMYKRLACRVAICRKDYRVTMKKRDAIVDAYKQIVAAQKWTNVLPLSRDLIQDIFQVTEKSQKWCKNYD